MHSIGMDDVGSALLIMLAFVAVSISIVALAMWGVHRFFRNKEEEKDLIKELDESVKDTKKDE